MKRIISFAIMLLLILPVYVFSAQFHSVPVGHEAYRIIDVAEMRGAIAEQSDVKPYNVNTVKALLREILSSDSFSDSEKSQINRVLDELDRIYGNDQTSGFSDIFKKGYLRTSAPNTIAAGGKVNTDFTFGKDSVDGSDKVMDIRIGATAYVNGDLFNFMSYDLNFKLNLERLDVRSTIPTDLQLDCDGFYLNLFDAEDGGEKLETLPDPTKRFYLGIEHNSEISMSFKDDTFTARIGTVRRDWGPGLNNIALSSSARAFDGIELSFKPAYWFSYSVMTGSLGLTYLETVNGVEWPSEAPGDFDAMFYNNISMHRVELGPFGGMLFGPGWPLDVKFGIWESVIWRKRFELAYLNPFTIYMFAQNSLGDFDNMLAGFDLSLYIKGIGQFYAALSMDEMNNAKLFACPRNILSYQVGFRFSPRILDFSQVSLQATYIPAFFGAHYNRAGVRIFEGLPYNTTYVNKGQLLSYPVNPDTIELLLDFQTTFGSGWLASLTIKNQMRSAQYSYKTTGTDIMTPMSYDAFYNGSGGDYGAYINRDFFDNIWNNVLQVSARVEKKLSSFPVTFYLGMTGIVDRTRSFEPTVQYDSYSIAYNPGRVTFTSDWVTTYTMNATFGTKIYY